MLWGISSSAFLQSGEKSHLEVIVHLELLTCNVAKHRFKQANNSCSNLMTLSTLFTFKLQILYSGFNVKVSRW